VIAEFEQRLAEVLGGLMPSPFGGRVQVAPGTVDAGEPAVLVGVTHTERLPDELGGNRPAVAPGAAEPRRVVRLRCTVTLEVRAAENAGREQQVDGLDAALYALDDPGFRRGTPLAGGAPDPGFLVHDLAVVEGRTPFGEDDPPVPAALSLRAEGLFWPPGVAGQAGDRASARRDRRPSGPWRSPCAGRPASRVPARSRAARREATARDWSTWRAAPPRSSTCRRARPRATG
jgi:hypothetical protein